MNALRQAARKSPSPQTRLRPEHRRFLFVEQVVGEGVINFLLNAAIAWALVRSMSSVPLWGDPSIAGDTAATSLLLPLITCLIVTPLVRRKIAAGGIPPIDEPPRSGLLQMLIARSTFVRGALIGLGCIVLAALPVVLWFVMAGVSGLSHHSFIWFKAVFAAALAAAVTPFIAWLALAPPSSGNVSS